MMTAYSIVILLVSFCLFEFSSAQCVYKSEVECQQDCSLPYECSPSVGNCWSCPSVSCAKKEQYLSNKKCTENCWTSCVKRTHCYTCPQNPHRPTTRRPEPKMEPRMAIMMDAKPMSALPDEEVDVTPPSTKDKDMQDDKEVVAEPEKKEKKKKNLTLKCEDIKDLYASKDDCEDLCPDGITCKEVHNCWQCARCDDIPNAYHTPQRCNFECKAKCEVEEKHHNCSICPHTDCKLGERSKASCEQMLNCEYGCELHPTKCWKCKKQVWSVGTTVCTLAVISVALIGLIVVILVSFMRQKGPADDDMTNLVR